MYIKNLKSATSHIFIFIIPSYLVDIFNRESAFAVPILQSTCVRTHIRNTSSEFSAACCDLLK